MIPCGVWSNVMEESWKNKKNTLCKLIKRISDLHGGDDLAWLTAYAKQVLRDWANHLDSALICFQDLAEQAEIIYGEKLVMKNDQTMA